MTAAPPGIDLGGNRRRWRDISTLRVTIALLVGPTLSLLLIVGIVLVLGGENMHFEESDLGVSAMMVAYWMLAGWCYLLLIPRRRGIISRVECLLLSVALTLIAPPVLVLPWEIMTSSPEAKIELVIENAIYAMRMQPGWAVVYWLVFSLFFLPLGVLCGWLLWRVGVRPASTRLTDAAAVFD